MNNKSNKNDNIFECLTNIANNMCTNYCKFSKENFFDDDNELEKLFNEHCKNCPMWIFSRR